MFGSVKSQKSDNQSIESGRKEVSKQPSAVAKEEVNFSMFDSMQKSSMQKRSSIESGPIVGVRESLKGAK
jgi:hypothetical protein